MKNISKFILILTALSLYVSACKKDYIVGGDIEESKKYKNLTNYEVLSQNPAFDTLVQIIDAAGLKDKINTAGTTFFAPSDFAIYAYLERRTNYVQQNYDQNAIFGLDSLSYYLKNNIANTRDSLLMYMINTPLNYGDLTRTGKAYETGLKGDTAIISYSPNGSSGPVSTPPRSVYYTHMWKHYDLSDAHPAEEIPEKVGVRTLCITSCIPTKSGYLNYLENFHTLFFFGSQL